MKKFKGGIFHAQLKLKMFFFKTYTHAQECIVEVITGCSFGLPWTGLVELNIEITYKTRHEKLEKHLTQYGLRLTKTYRLRGY